MENKPELSFFRILENIRFRFAFLFRRGFHVVSAVFLDQKYENWQVTMATNSCIVKIYSYTGKVGMALSIPQLYSAVGLLKLNDLIDGINEEVEEHATDEPQSLESVAWLLEEHLDEILEKIGKMLILVSIDDPSIPPSKPGQLSRYN